MFRRIYKYKDTISFWTLLDDNARNKSVKLPESSAVLQIVNTWMQNKNYPLVKLQVDGDDLIVKQVNNQSPPVGHIIIIIIIVVIIIYNNVATLVLECTDYIRRYAIKL